MSGGLVVGLAVAAGVTAIVGPCLNAGTGAGLGAVVGGVIWWAVATGHIFAATFQGSQRRLLMFSQGEDGDYLASPFFTANDDEVSVACAVSVLFGITGSSCATGLLLWYLRRRLVRKAQEDVIKERLLMVARQGAATRGRPESMRRRRAAARDARGFLEEAADEEARAGNGNPFEAPLRLVNLLFVRPLVRKFENSLTGFIHRHCTFDARALARARRRADRAAARKRKTVGSTGGGAETGPQSNSKLVRAIRRLMALLRGLKATADNNIAGKNKQQVAPQVEPARHTMSFTRFRRAYSEWCFNRDKKEETDKTTILRTLARQDSSFSIGCLPFTAMASIFIPVYCFAMPRQAGLGIPYRVRWVEQVYGVRWKTGLPTQTLALEALRATDNPHIAEARKVLAAAGGRGISVGGLLDVFLSVFCDAKPITRLKEKQRQVGTQQVQAQQQKQEHQAGAPLPEAAAPLEPPTPQPRSMWVIRFNDIAAQRNQKGKRTESLGFKRQGHILPPLYSTGIYARNR